MQIFIVGCGYVGTQVAKLALAQGHWGRATARTTPSAERLSELGLVPVAADLDIPGSLDSFTVENATVLYCVPPPPFGKTDPRMRAFLENIQPAELPDKVVLISTTGVYGDCGGDWVDETRPVNPQSDRARRRVDAEQRLQRWSAAHGVPAVILRVPGIYGPGRLPVERLRRGLPVLAEELSPYSNRVHVHDLARACLAALEHGQPGIYNISDGHPSTMTDYFMRVADALGLPRPPVVDREAAAKQLSEEMRGYLAESKRLDNRKMREELGVVPDYPDLAGGLAQCVAAQGGA